MPGTDSTWSQDTANNDLEIFISGYEFRDVNALAAYSMDASAVIMLTAAASQTVQIAASAVAFLKRTGMYATPGAAQQQFGTAASMPGPSQVAGTSDPEGIRGYPPFLVGAPAANPPYYSAAGGTKLATLIGPQAGPVPKGCQLNSIDVIYSVPGSGNLTSAVIQANAFNFVNNQATSTGQTKLIANAQNGLLLAAQANPYRINIPVPTGSGAVQPGMLITPDTSLQFALTIACSTTATLRFYGIVAKCSFNFN